MSDTKDLVVVSKTAIEEIEKSVLNRIDKAGFVQLSIQTQTKFEKLLSTIQPLESFEQRAFEAGRMLSNPPELNYTIHKYKSFTDYQQSK